MREHTFLPKLESQKLDEVKDQMEARPGTFQLIKMAWAHPWILVALGWVCGGLAGIWLKSRT